MITEIDKKLKRKTNDAIKIIEIDEETKDRLRT